MRILMLSWEFPPYVVGGLGKHVAELAPALDQIAVGDEPLIIDIVTPRTRGARHIEKFGANLTVHRVDTTPMHPLYVYSSVVEGNQPLIDRAQELAQEHAYDLIHVHEWLTATAGIALKHAWQTPLLVTIHATERGRHRGYLPSELSLQINHLEWLVCFEAWRVIVCSRYMVQELVDFFSVPMDKIDIIPNGVDSLPLQNCDPAQVTALRQRYAPTGQRLLFYVGRITPEKGLQTLLEAMPYILVKHPDVRLLIAGKNSEKMQAQVDDLGIQHQVSLLGFISDEERNCLYQTVDAAIFPSLYEPFGIVALEAMAANCPVIASGVGGLADVVEHMQNGLTILPNDPRSIAWAVDRLVEDGQRVKQWRQRARRQIQERYGWPTIAAQTAQLYARIVTERQGVIW